MYCRELEQAATYFFCECIELELNVPIVFGNELHISCQVSSLCESEQKVADLLGATEGFLSRRATGQRGKKVTGLSAVIVILFVVLGCPLISFLNLPI